jgi:predicted dehydrogenase
LSFLGDPDSSVATMTRRTLFQSGALAMTAASYSRILGANDRINIGIIGCGARGSYLQAVFQKLNKASLVAVCDVWKTRAEQALKVAPGALLSGDHRKTLETPSIDAVIIATADHWHAPIAIDALNAGKDVYVEKPLTLTMEEGPCIVHAARSSNRICQVGAQQRSGSHYIEARDRFIKSGQLGKISLVRTWWFDGGSGLPPKPGSGSHATPVGITSKPDDLDWNRYIAPVKWREWDPPQFFNFRNYIDLNGGIMTDKFVHWVDVVHMFMGEDGPISADTSGGTFFARDGRTVPDTLNVHLEYPSKWICTYSNTPQAGLQREGIEFCGTHGHLRIDRTKYEFLGPERDAKPAVTSCKTDLVEEHVQNFLDCCRSRKLPNGDVQAGHRSAQAAHLANLSYAQRRRINFDPEREIVLSSLW